MSAHTKRQLEKFKVELRDFELYMIEDGLILLKTDATPEDDKRIEAIIKKLYSEAYN